MAKRQEKEDSYVQAMRVWFAQRTEEILSCQRAIERFRRKMAFSKQEIEHAQKCIVLEKRQIALARRDVRQGQKDVQKHCKGQKAAGKKKSV